jgi:hypothetical protein
MAIHDANQDNLEHPLEPQHELNALPWPFLLVFFVLLTAAVFWVIAN